MYVIFILVNLQHFARWRYWITKTAWPPRLHSLSSNKHSTHVMVGSNAGKAASSTQRDIQVACTFYTTPLFTSIRVRRQQTHKLSINKKIFLLPSSICHYADVICSRTIGKIPSPTFIKFVELVWHVLRFQSYVHMLHQTIITQIYPRSFTEAK
jgi:hypothetical protein